jgi:hypothetical protein
MAHGVTRALHVSVGGYSSVDPESDTSTDGRGTTCTVLYHCHCVAW